MIYTLSNYYEQVYDDLLQSIGNSTRVPSLSLTAFWPMCGHRYDHKLMVIGRSVNRWRGNNWTPEKTKHHQSRGAIRRNARKHSENHEGDGRCPMSWIIEREGASEGYNTKKSAFWRVFRSVALSNASCPTSLNSWSSCCCWSNLYKIAPSSGGNPTISLRRQQTPIATRLVAQEIKEFKPRTVLVLAGYDWFEPFADAFGLRLNWQNGYVEAVAQQRGRLWIIAKHPERKPEMPFVTEVLKAMSLS